MICVAQVKGGYSVQYITLQYSTKQHNAMQCNKEVQGGEKEEMHRFLLLVPHILLPIISSSQEECMDTGTTHVSSVQYLPEK